MHGLNTYDYGARQHDPILARWDRIDPLCEKYYSTSPYAYCMNNPIIFTDPDGEAIRLSISNIASDQKGTIKVCTNDGARYKAYVPLYPLTVTDDEHDVTTSYFVTRDAPCTDNGGQSFYNKAFEPNKAIGEYTGIFVNEYKDTGHGGILLQENGGSALSTDPQRPGDKVGEAIGIFIHVGGYYEKKDLKTYLTGSLGYLGIANRQIDEFINDIMGRLENCEDKTIIINIAKRNDVEWETDGKEWSVQPF